jgi:hypothetical protein
MQSSGRIRQQTQKARKFINSTKQIEERKNARLASLENENYVESKKAVVDDDVYNAEEDEGNHNILLR